MLSQQLYVNKVMCEVVSPKCLKPNRLLLPEKYIWPFKWKLASIMSPTRKTSQTEAKFFMHETTADFL